MDSGQADLPSMADAQAEVQDSDMTPGDAAAEPDGPDGATTLPRPERTINVSSSGELDSAIANAKPGAHIVLASGNYSGLTVSQNGTPSSPIVIRAADRLVPKVGGNITLSGDYVWVVGVDVTGGGRVSILGTGNRFSSSRLRSSGTAITAETGSRSAIIDHNEVDSQASESSRSWHGIRTNHGDRSGSRHHIFRNYLHGAPKITTGDDNSAYGTYAEGDSGVKTSDIIEYNLFLDWLGDAETLSMKSGGNIVRFNTLENCEQIVNRHNSSNHYIANWLEASRYIRVHDRDHLLVGNHGDIQLMAGDVRPPFYWGGPPNHPAAWNNLLIGNEGKLIVGYQFSGDEIRAENNHIEAHKGAIEERHQANTTKVPNASRTVPDAVRLRPSDVGPNAPTAPSF